MEISYYYSINNPTQSNPLFKVADVEREWRGEPRDYVEKQLLQATGNHNISDKAELDRFVQSRGDLIKLN